ncbi:Similar to Ift80: Intraflagellar transport protein 80 homolog (Rattus norvegicus) [Cotesia congregata]|uniref:Similar to Ift80: Intraflagellar transport protein 80 homolog (Rattus norvegicus) n=1 Tax=Cotesia congregata TaxID=51543 RepID=A0A8J2H6E4_COTCN|nr:Similar to Ift80: Intraflagellar transport protein 80 homolog (Rattus norvegicus) [Cotesia congregata]
MKFKVSLWEKNGHTKIVTCVAWNSAEEIYSIGEDHVLLCWHLDGSSAQTTKIAEFPEDFYPTDMQWHPRAIQNTGTSIKKQSHDVVLITTADGKFYLVNKSGRIEKTVDGHKGAILRCRWSYDGSALLTAGEDGVIKVWSRSGMLRSTVVRSTHAILSAVWSPDSLNILYSQGSQLALQPLNFSSKSKKWYAHEGLILTVSWNRNNNFIISGGEDCRYKVWDGNGNLLFTSAAAEYPITCVEWSPNGNYFAVGSYNTIKLCDKTGWSHSLEKVNTGSIYSIGWSNDSTQVAMGCGNAAVLMAHVIDRRLEWENYEATLIKRKTIQVREIGNNSGVVEMLEISDRVVHMELAFNYLVVVTTNQCHIYSSTNWNTPVIFDLKNSTISAVILAEKHFLLIEWNVMTLYSYQGRLLSVPKWKGMTPDEALYPPCIALCSDTLVLLFFFIIINLLGISVLHILELSSNKPVNETHPHLHTCNVNEIAINRIGGAHDRQLAFIDVTRDLFLITIRSSGFGRICKIAAMAQSISWAIDANVLAAMLDATLSIWLCPNCVHYSDRKIIRRTRIDKENNEFGKQPSIVNVKNGIVTVRRGDGALIAVSFYTFFTTLHHHVMNNKWQDALSLCRITQNDILWTCMAVMATENKQLSAAEEAYAAIERYDKVDYIQYIDKISNKTEKLAEMSLLAGDLLAAEGILLQHGFIDQAIRINIQMYNWSRALELAVRHKKQVDQVLEAREMYLKLLDKKETNPSYISLIKTTRCKSSSNIITEMEVEADDDDNNNNKSDDED